MGAVIEVETLSHPMMPEFSMRWEKGPSGGQGGAVGQRRAVGEAGELRRERSKLGGPREQHAAAHGGGKGPAEVPE